jgi:uncharacterized membrane protein SpoIIM required for sporulation
MFILGFTYSLLGILLGLWVFGKYASIAGIFLTTIPLVVIMYLALNSEEEKDMKICKEFLLMKEHMHILWFFLYLFVGMVLAYAMWFSLMPIDLVNQSCSSQLETISAINSQFAPTGAATQYNRLETIIVNNLRVLTFCILFSLIYGAGAIFILTWNASVIGVAVGVVVRQGLAHLSILGHNPTLYNYFTILPVGLSYLIHGIPEVASYFLGSLAGGIISVAVVCHHYRSREFWHVLQDSLDLIVLSLLVLFMAAMIEVYVTPAIFNPFAGLT